MQVKLNKQKTQKTPKQLEVVVAEEEEAEEEEVVAVEEADVVVDAAENQAEIRRHKRKRVVRWTG